MRACVCSCMQELSLVDDDTIIQEEDEQVDVSSEVPMKVDISRGERERGKRRDDGRESPIAMMTQRPKTPEETGLTSFNNDYKYYM